MFMEKSNGANLAPAKYMHVMYKCRVSLVGGGGCPKYMYLEMKNKQIHKQKPSFSHYSEATETDFHGQYFIEKKGAGSKTHIQLRIQVTPPPPTYSTYKQITLKKSLLFPS